MSVPKPARSAVPSRDTLPSTPVEKSLHTPAPWKLAHSGFANTPFVIYVGDKAPDFRTRYPLVGVDVIAEVFLDESPRHPEYIANGHLLVAAPKLFKALRSLLEQFHAYQNGWLGEGLWRTRIGLPDDLAEAEDAVNEARGDQ